MNHYSEFYNFFYLYFSDREFMLNFDQNLLMKQPLFQIQYWSVSFISNLNIIKYNLSLIGKFFAKLDFNQLHSCFSVFIFYFNFFFYWYLIFCFSIIQHREHINLPFIILSLKSFLLLMCFLQIPYKIFYILLFLFFLQ